MKCGEGQSEAWISESVWHAAGLAHKVVETEILRPAKQSTGSQDDNLG